MRYFRDCEQPLWTIGVGSGGEFRGRYLLHWNATVVEGGHELTGSWKLGVRDRECGPNHERGTEEVVNRASALSDEQTLALARLPALEVSRYRENAHGTGTRAGMVP